MPAPATDAPPRALPACLAWVAGLGALVALGLSDRLPLRPSFLEPADVHGAFVGAQAFFLVFAWPFFGRLGEGGVLDRLGRAALLPLLGLPLSLVCANLSGTGPGPLLRGLLLVGALAACVTALRGGETGRSPGYLLGAGVVAAGFPIAAFIVREFGAADWTWLAALSPLWAAVHVGRGPDLACAGLLALAAVALLWADAPRRAST
jgi:hypothetical protein